jgi:hypothetical protein
MNGGKRFSIQVLAACVVLSASALPALSQAGGASPTARTADQRKQDDIDRVMEFFRLTQPDVFDQAQALRGSNPARFDRLIMGALPTVNRLEALRRKSQQLFDLSIQDLQLGYQSLRIAQRLKRTDLSDADRAKLTEQLKAVVAAEFVVQQQIRQLEINDLQQKVQDLDSQVKGREMDQQNIIQKRVQDLVERNPRLEW